MIKLREYDINPFKRSERYTSYSDNIGEKYPALLVENFAGYISVYDYCRRRKSSVIKQKDR